MGDLIPQERFEERRMARDQAQANRLAALQQGASSNQESNRTNGQANQNAQQDQDEGRMGFGAFLAALVLALLANGASALGALALGTGILIPLAVLLYLIAACFLFTVFYIFVSSVGFQKTKGFTISLGFDLVTAGLAPIWLYIIWYYISTRKSGVIAKAASLAGKVGPASRAAQLAKISAMASARQTARTTQLAANYQEDQVQKKATAFTPFPQRPIPPEAQVAEPSQEHLAA